MVKISAPRGEELKKLHKKIEAEYHASLRESNGKGKMKIMEELASKYGYSSGQSIRNILNGNARK